MTVTAAYLLFFQAACGFWKVKPLLDNKLFPPGIGFRISTGYQSTQINTKYDPGEKAPCRGNKPYISEIFIVLDMVCDAKAYLSYTEIFR
jgi:hypothetical protein